VDENIMNSLQGLQKLSILWIEI